MYDPIELQIDVTDAASLGTKAQVAVTVFLPDEEERSEPQVVCFAFPGGGYCRRYYSFDMPDGSGGGQAGWHVARGWIFVTCDHLGFGDSTIPAGNILNYGNVAAGNRAAVDEVMRRLEAGTMRDGFAPVLAATKIGIGQSMGGCFTIVLQAHHGIFDGIASLGYSGIHTVVPSRPGTPQAVMPWIPRQRPRPSRNPQPSRTRGGDRSHPVRARLDHRRRSRARAPARLGLPLRRRSG